jgi:hypothetical protein
VVGVTAAVVIKDVVDVITLLVVVDEEVEEEHDASAIDATIRQVNIIQINPLFI